VFIYFVSENPPAVPVVQKSFSGEWEKIHLEKMDNETIKEALPPLVRGGDFWP